MRLSMKSFIPYNSPCSASIHVPTHQHCSFTTLTHQLAFKSQQSIHHHSLSDFESSFLNSIPLPASVVKSGQVSRLSKCWEEYMGVRDWAGLLDPLDKNLAHEILQYGNFIEAAYRAFDFDPRSPTYGSCKFHKKSMLDDCGVLGGGYKVTRYLHATSGIQVPVWARSSWAAMQTSWIGYVAVSHDKATINRLGRREVVITLRGTATCLEWLENLRATLAPVSSPTLSDKTDNVGLWNQYGPPMVESGFLSLYTSSTDTWPSLKDSIKMEVSQLLETYKDEPLSITITGHSLGAALAKLAAHDIKTTFDRDLLVTVISFGGPRVGNKSFRSLVDKHGTKILRVVNPSDLITKVPGFVTDNKGESIKLKPESTKNKSHHDKIVHNKHNHMIKISDHRNNNPNDNSNSNSNSNNNPLIKFIARWIRPFQRDDKHWWLYAEVGHELRLETEEEEEMPYYLDNINVAKCHDLKTYLNLVEGCPLKAFIKRSLKKIAHRCNNNNDKNKASALAV